MIDITDIPTSPFHNHYKYQLIPEHIHNTHTFYSQLREIFLQNVNLYF